MNMSDTSNDHNKTDDNMESGDQNASSDPPRSEYVKELLKEKIALDPGNNPHASRLLDEEITQAQSKGKDGKKDMRFLDIYRDKSIRVSVKVLVPVKEHPRFNFVGKLLGPKGNSLKRLQEETMTRMAILGRGSMRDRQKEEEYRNALDPKYAHLTDDLHVEIVALAPPAEAHARIAYALAELRKYLVPDSNDDIRMEQMREMQSVPGRGRGRAGPPSRAPPGPGSRGNMGAMPLLSRPMPGKAKVLSILDRARVAMEDSYPEEQPPYYEPPQPVGYDAGYNGAAQEYYDTSYAEPGPGRWKGYGGGKSMGGGGGGRFGSNRGSPYARPTK